MRFLCTLKAENFRLKVNALTNDPTTVEEVAIRTARQQLEKYYGKSHTDEINIECLECIFIQ